MHAHNKERIDREMKYRFDDAYQNVYEYSPEHDAYIYVSTYVKSGIDGRWSEARKIEQMEKNFWEWHHGKIED
jgi:hypothetical protein